MKTKKDQVSRVDTPDGQSRPRTAERGQGAQSPSVPESE